MNKFYVYCLRRPDKEDPFNPGKGCPFYVGKGSNGRLNEHRWEAKALLHKSGRKAHKINIIHNLWNRGLDFEEEVLFKNLIEQQAFECEISTIAIYGRQDKGTGVLTNRTDGGEGVLLSDEVREKMRKAATGRPLSEQAKRKLSIANQGGGNGFYGKKHTEEARRKNGEAHQRKLPPRREDWCKNISKSKIGHVVSKTARKKIGDAFRGKPWTEARRKAQEKRKSQCGILQK